MIPAPELIDQLAALHEDAFVWAMACNGGNAEAGGEALQDAYVKVASGRTTFRGDSSLKTWWFAVVRLTAMERRRGHQRWHRPHEIFQEWITSLAGEPAPSMDDGPAAPPDPEQLGAALARLPPRQAEVLHLVFQQGLSVSESAGIMGVSLGSARQHYDRAKRRLRSLLNSEKSPIACDHET